MPDNITWLAIDTLPNELQDLSQWGLMCEARGRTYQVRCGSGIGVLCVSQQAFGKVRDNIKANGGGVICPMIDSQGHGVYTNYHRGSGRGRVGFQLLIKAIGHISHDIHGQCTGQTQPIQAHATGKGYIPLWSTCDLSLLFPYFSNFFPEVADQIPAPIPEQDSIKLHILDQVVKGVEFHGDTRVWTLIGVTYLDKPVMNLRNAPASSYPMRHIIDLHQYKLMIGFLARLWDIRPIMVEAAPPGPMTQRHLAEMERQRYLR